MSKALREVILLLDVCNIGSPCRFSAMASQFLTYLFCGVQLVGLLPYEQANADEWSKVGGSCTLDVCEGFSITFAHSGARHQARAQIFPEVGPNGASHVAQWFEALRNIPESDTAGMEEVTKTYLRKPEVRGGTKKT